MDPIRILHVVGAMNRGGAEILIMELYKNINRSKIQFDFLVHSREKSLFDDDISNLGGRIFRLKNRFYRNPISYLHELYIFFTMHSEYKCVHSHMNDMSGYILWIGAKAQIPIRIAHSHTAYSKTDNLRQFGWWL